jgi:hypothetical protein
MNISTTSQIGKLKPESLVQDMLWQSRKSSAVESLTKIKN